MEEEGTRTARLRAAAVKKPETLKHIEKKLFDKGVHRLDRHPADGLGGVKRPPPKCGHGGKFTWEGPESAVESELEAAPPVVDEKDPNYVDEAAEEKIVKGEEEEVAGLVVGEVEVAKAAEDREGVARIEVDPHLSQGLKEAQ